MNSILPLVNTGIGVLVYFLVYYLRHKTHPKKKSKKTHRQNSEQELTASEMSDGNTTSGYLTEAGTDIADLRRLVIPRLVDSPLHPHSKRVFDALSSLYL